MAIDYSGLFATPTDLRNKRMDALQQQRSQVGAMGGSMAGLLGQVAAGGGALGAQLAENIGQGFGLQTRQEKEAERTQAQMKDAMSGNLVKMQNLQKKLSESGNADPRMMLLLEQRINTQRDRVKAEEDRRRQIARQTASDKRADSAENRASAEAARSAQRFDFTVEDRQAAADLLDTETKQAAAMRAAAVTRLRGTHPDFADLVEAGFDPATYLELGRKASALDLTEVGSFNDGTTEFVGGIDKNTNQLVRANEKGMFVPIGDSSNVVKGKLTAPKGSGAPTKSQLDQVNSLATVRQGASALIAASAPLIEDPDAGFFGGSIPDPAFKDAFVAQVAQRANDIVAQSKGTKDFGLASNEAMQEALTELESKQPKELTPEQKVIALDDAVMDNLARGIPQMIDGVMSIQDEKGNIVPVYTTPDNMNYGALINQYTPSSSKTQLTGAALLEALKGAEGQLTPQDKANLGGYANYLN